MSTTTTQSKSTYMCLDGLAIEIGYEDSEAGELLDFLLLDMSVENPQNEHIIARFSICKDQRQWVLSQHESEYKIRHPQLNDLALPLLNKTMRVFAELNARSISLHAALVSDKTGSILMPGAPGSGKSNACLWLSHLGMHYHTDEYVTINRQDMSLNALTRPYTLRREALSRMQKLTSLSVADGTPEMRTIESSSNAWISHRLINPCFQRDIPKLKAIVFPVHTTGSDSQICEISRAHVGMELMRTHFQSESFADHGFSTISSLARKLPAYLMLYKHYDQITNLLADLIDFSRGS